MKLSSLFDGSLDGYAVRLSSLFVGSLDGYAVRLSSLFVGSLDGYAVRLSSLFDGSLDGYAVDFRPLWNEFYDRSGSSLLWNGSIDDYVMRFYRDQGHRLFASPLAVLRFRWFVGHLRQSNGVGNRDILYWLALFLRIHIFEAIESYPSYYGLFHPPRAQNAPYVAVWRCGASGETNQQWT